MLFRFEDLSIRMRIVLLILGILLPVGAILSWFLAADVRQARQAAFDQVRIVADGTAAELQRQLQRSGDLLARLAARPQIQAMDRTQCDPLAAEMVRLQPAYLALALRDRRGTSVCSYLLDALPQRDTAPAPWFERGLASGGLRASDVIDEPASGRKVTVLTYPVHNGAGAPVGLLVLPVDLLALSRQLLGSTPGHAVVSVVDSQRVVLLRSAQADVYVGRGPSPGVPDPAPRAQRGFVSMPGRDGMRRLFAFVTLPAVGWRVSAGLPEAEVFAQYRAVRERTLAIGLGVLALALIMAWRLSAAIARPIAALEGAATRVAAGDEAARARVAGPPEIRAVARQFNLMLDARALSEGRLLGIFDSASDAILTTDESQTIVMANKAAAKMFGCSVEALVDGPLDRLIPERHRAAHRREVQEFGRTEVLSRPMGRRPELRGLRADGQEFPIEAAISHVHVEGQRLYTVILRDITERLQADAALRASKATLETALASMNDAVCICDAQGRLVEINEAFAAFHRFASRQECLAAQAEHQRLLELRTLDGALLPPTSWPAARALRGETATGAEYRLRRLDSGQSWIGSYSFAPIRAADGAITGSVVTGRDITALRQAQSDLEASHADLKRLVAALDHIQDGERKRIARELHDDLQQTLAAIRIDAGQIGAELHGDPARIPPLVARIDELAGAAIASTRRIVNDLRPRMLEELGLVASLEALAARFTQRAGAACDVRADGVGGDDGEIALEVATCLYRAAQEALNNVAKHAAARQVHIDLSSSAGGGLRMRISDDGVGMAADARGKLQSFGLLGMNERVLAAGGRLQIDSTPGAGTTIEIAIPAPGGAGA